MSLSREAVIWAYRLLLGREPENEVVIQEKLDNTDNLAQLRDAMMNSEEFSGRITTPKSNLSKRKFRQIDTQVDAEILEQMFQRISKEWIKMGEEEPYWSVLTSDRFLAKNIDENQKTFSVSGRRDAKMVELFLERAGKEIPKGTCLELGCGVGRVTEFLAPKFDKVIGLDISDGNLRICNERIKAAGLRNVETQLIRSPKDYATLENYDFLFSTIVFQHNPPPIQYYMLDQLLARLNKGGFCLFQIPTSRPEYSFEADSYLQSEAVQMEMHALPMVHIFNLMAKHSCQPLEVVLDNSTGEEGSYLFFAERTG
ncbi:class I SAM-dependent methyltransferase [Rhodovibrionaceae bacterium A322]